MITICDTGPLLSCLDRKDPYQQWALEAVAQLQPPMLVCEPVLTEAAYFLRASVGTAEPLFGLLERGVIRIDFDACTHWPRMRALMARYAQMDLADAAVVVMTELHRHSQVLTLDRRDFSIYRRNDRQVIHFLAPEK